MARNFAGFFFGLFGAVMVFGYAAQSSDNAKRERVSPTAAAHAMHAPPIVHPQAVAQPSQSLAQARGEFATKILLKAPRTTVLPNPPAEFIRSDYQSDGRTLPAFVTRDPNDGLRYPAVVWVGGGDANSSDINSLGEFWNDAAASAFRNAGVVTMFPTLRGGNEDAASKEYFYGEVDDVLAAAKHLATLRHVNPERIYLGGHGTGGTLVLLAAEMGVKFAGVFAFGPVAEVDRYPPALVPFDFNLFEERERRIRSPIHWLESIESETFVIEGTNAPSNRSDAEALCAKANNPRVRCLLIDDADHFSVLKKVSTVIAARVVVSDSIQFAVRADEFN